MPCGVQVGVVLENSLSPALQVDDLAARQLGAQVSDVALAQLHRLAFAEARIRPADQTLQFLFLEAQLLEGVLEGNESFSATGFSLLRG